ncbi:hypothetical protein GCM10011491_34870 [Brucella endophytica]|uniref:Uncharacterized protein n=2 Tax=Brucella endophytica TaxID=1963359 RepID=A0A916SJX0_9HYPH|nr:hypothetical protein GCM10011491_34870 [Brucella endophytica]
MPDPYTSAYAAEIVRWCITVRGRPTGVKQRFLEEESPPLLAYLERLAVGDGSGWHSLNARISEKTQELRERGMKLKRPWMAAIWHVLPDLEAIGEVILDRQAAASASDNAPTASDAVSGSGGGDDKGSAGAGKAGTAAKPHPAPRLMPRGFPVTLSRAEKRALDLEDKAKADEAANQKKKVEAESEPAAPTLKMGGAR